MNQLTETVTVDGDTSTTLESDTSGDSGGQEQENEEQNNDQSGYSGGGDDSAPEPEPEPESEPEPEPNYNCEDFTNWEDAEEIYDENPDDPHGLDDDDDGVPCETLPGAPEDGDSGDGGDD